MRSLGNVLLHTTDQELAQRIRIQLRHSAIVREAQSVDDLTSLFHASGPVILLLDTRHREAVMALPDLLQGRTNDLLIALGEPRSDMMRAVEDLGAYAVEDLSIEGPRLRALIHRATEHARMLQENSELRTDTMHAPALPRPAPLLSGDLVRRPLQIQLRQFSQALRRFNKVDALLEAVIETVCTAVNVSRAGIFFRGRTATTFSLGAAMRCLEETKSIEYSPKHPLVRWMDVQAHLVARSNIDHVRVPGERQMLRQALDQMGAEVIIPLHARGQLLGWLFVGHRATGIPFDVADLEDLSVLADHVSTVLENAMLYEEVAVQKTLGDTLLHSMPTGIVAVDLDGVVRWFNTAAQKILDVPPSKVLMQPSKVLGSRLADLLHRTMHHENIDQPIQWTEPQTRKYISAQAHRLMNGDTCLGAVALIHDLTIERMLEEKREQLERTAFWTELAASMSHEIRNPLVAIKTFAQLLPERFNDDDFRKDFSNMVSSEVDRLNGIIEQIDSFAHPPDLQFHPVGLRQVIHRALSLASMRFGKNGVAVENQVPEQLPRIMGDEAALSDGFSRLIENAMEALGAREGGRIEVTARYIEETSRKPHILITVKDNGPGIPRDIRDKVFSPFCTTKARGMGLGLPIAKRTIVDHDGSIEVESSDKGTAVSVLLPSMSEISHEPEVQHETYTDRG